MTEEWKRICDIPKYKDFTNYSVSNLGRVRNDITGKILKGTPHSMGYTQVTLCANGVKPVHPPIHILVGNLFIPNPQNLPQLNHKDEVKTNNRVDNLEWCTQAYNNRYGTKPERISKANSGKNNPMYGTISPMRGKTGRKHHGSKKVIQYDLNTGDVIREYECISETKKYGFTDACVSDVCNGKFKQHKGYGWKFADKK